MPLLFTEKGVSLIGPPWSGKTTIGKIAADILERKLGVRSIFHDMDSDGLEGRYGWGVGGVAKKLILLGDEGFLQEEGDFVQEHYGGGHEKKAYNLDHLLFCASGSLPLSIAAMNYVRSRSAVILIDAPLSELEKRSCPTGRPDGNTRIVGMNGENPRFRTLREALEYRGGIYRTSASYVFPYKNNESPQESGIRLAEMILSREG